MEDKNHTVIYYGADWCPDCVRVKNWLEEHNIDFESKDVGERDQPIKNKALKEMLSLSNGVNLIPTIVINGISHQNPSNQDLKELLEMPQDKANMEYEVVMIGAGPSALAAAVYTTREEVSTVLIEKGVIGGLAAITDMVDNYPGFSEGVTGIELAQQLQKQAERFGAKIELGEVRKITDEGEYKRITTESGDFLAKAVLIATGTDYKKLGVPGEEEFYGRGVHFCATCDGAFYKNRKLVVVGGGNSAVQEALFLTRFASHIDMLVRSDKMRASEILQKRIKDNDKITIHYNTTTEEIIGEDNKVVSVRGHDKDKDEDVVFETDGVFVFVGLLPNTGFLKDSAIELDEFGFIKTQENQMTSMEGVFCSGDVRSGATMQIASAVGEGATAALRIREYLEHLENH